MKKLMFAFCFIFGGLVAVNAQDTTSTQRQTQQYPTTTSQDDQDRERINSRDLPDPVKRSLEATEYRGWLVNAAYKSTGVNDQSMSNDSTSNQNDSTSYRAGSQNDSTSMSGQQNGAYGQEIYVVELKNGAQTKTVRFDKDGNKLDDGMNNNDQDK